MKRQTSIGFAVLAAFTVLVAAMSIQAHEKGAVQAQESGNLMQQKLDHAQKLLSALSLADYDEMIAHSRELQRISLEANWSIPPSSGSTGFGYDFRNALDRLVASAEKQNIDGAALNYVQVVLTCIECHKVVREGEGIAQAGKLDVLELLSSNTAANHGIRIEKGPQEDDHEVL